MRLHVQRSAVGGTKSGLQRTSPRHVGIGRWLSIRPAKHPVHSGKRYVHRVVWLILRQARFYGGSGNNNQRMPWRFGQKNHAGIVSPERANESARIFATMLILACATRA